MNLKNKYHNIHLTLQQSEVFLKNSQKKSEKQSSHILGVF